MNAIDGENVFQKLESCGAEFYVSFFIVCSKHSYWCCVLLQKTTDEKVQWPRFTRLWKLSFNIFLVMESVLYRYGKNCSENRTTVKVQNPLVASVSKIEVEIPVCITRENKFFLACNKTLHKFFRITLESIIRIFASLPNILGQKHKFLHYFEAIPKLYRNLDRTYIMKTSLTLRSF